MNTLMDLKGSIPVFIHITHGRVYDIKIPDKIPIQPGAIHIMGRGYIDFARLNTIHRQGGQFAIRTRKNLKYYRRSSIAVDTSMDLQCDQRIRLTLAKTKADYPDVLRRVNYIKS